MSSLLLVQRPFQLHKDMPVTTGVKGVEGGAQGIELLRSEACYRYLFDLIRSP